MSQEKLKDVKVTFIETTYFNTDAENFMALVQKLTGKEPSKANKMTPAQIAPQAYGAVVLPSTALSKMKAPCANEEFEIEAVGTKDVVDEVDSWFVELEPHLDDLYEFMNQ
ncbi:hypothetical protein FCM35_KLT05655 [Carex littledalei]|uniref:VQ domain-containing protein n=1 Tax=Carex littledalei TaxID=544730 RepID=A0A833QYB9_9POAL|nr:hypothetical protein FCM35_KLT05655 [Carex littledalei]